MNIWTGDVTLTKTWSGVEVEAKNETEAELMLNQMKEIDLDKAVAPDEDVVVDNLECTDCDEDEDKEDED